jgi:hypothetical protein
MGDCIGFWNSNNYPLPGGTRPRAWMHAMSCHGSEVPVVHNPAHTPSVSCCLHRQDGRVQPSSAPCLRRCRASQRVEAHRLSSPCQDASLAQTRASARPPPVLDTLRPSIHCQPLRDVRCTGSPLCPRWRCSAVVFLPGHQPAPGHHRAPAEQGRIAQEREPEADGGQHPVQHRARRRANLRAAV